MCVVPIVQAGACCSARESQIEINGSITGTIVMLIQADYNVGGHSRNWPNNRSAVIGRPSRGVTYPPTRTDRHDVSISSTCSIVRSYQVRGLFSRDLGTVSIVMRKLRHQRSDINKTLAPAREGTMIKIEQRCYIYLLLVMHELIVYL